MEAQDSPPAPAADTAEAPAEAQQSPQQEAKKGSEEEAQRAMSLYTQFREQMRRVNSAMHDHLQKKRVAAQQEAEATLARHAAIRAKAKKGEAPDIRAMRDRLAGIRRETAADASTRHLHQRIEAADKLIEARSKQHFSKLSSVATPR